MSLSINKLKRNRCCFGRADVCAACHSIISGRGTPLHTCELAFWSCLSEFNYRKHEFHRYFWTLVSGSANFAINVGLLPFLVIIFAAVSAFPSYSVEFWLLFGVFDLHLNCTNHLTVSCYVGMKASAQPGQCVPWHTFE